MKTYELWLHYKQGDDLAAIAEKNTTTAAAFREWATSFGRCREVCLQITKAIEGKNVTIQADTHHISLEPGDADAERALEALVREEILSVHEWNDEEEGDPVIGDDEPAEPIEP